MLRLRHASLLALLSILVCAAPSDAQIGSVQSAWSANTNAFETDGIESVAFSGTVSTGCQVYVGVMLSATNRTISSVADDGSNTYALSTSGGTDATTQNGSSGTEVWIYEAPVTSTMQTVTVTISSALATPARVATFAVCGQHGTTPTEDTAVRQNGASADTSHPTGPVTAAGEGNAAFGIISGTNGVYNTSDGWTSIGSVTNFHAGYITGLSSGDTTWTPTTAAGEQTASALVSITPAAAGASGPPLGSLGLLGVGR